MHLIADSKVCSNCKLEFPISKFSQVHENGNRLNTCNVCRGLKNKQRLAALSPEELEKRRVVQRACTKSYRRKMGPSLQRKQDLMFKYGITPEAFEGLKISQCGKCAICGTADPRGKHGVFCVDHCHETGRVRGLLCQRCNVALGALGDNEASLQKVLHYVTPRNFPKIEQKNKGLKKGAHK
jgi:hypothetical protein